jgi:Ca2+-binding EF-hand superfamily protein
MADEGKKKKSKKSEGEGGDKPASKKKAQRTGSNVFAMFTQHQVQEFKEAFGFIDQDKDGFISKNDIRASFDALGRICTEKELDDMMSEAPGPINFTMFLTIFGDRVQGTDDEEVILNAFAQYDEGDGKCDEQKLRHALMTWGERFSKDECDIALAEAPVSNGRIDIKKLATLITRGDQEEQAA